MKINDSYDRGDSASIERYAKRLVGHTLSEMIVEKGIFILDRATTRAAKGRFGTVLERDYFRIRPKNDEGVPDFDEAGVELKSSPVHRKKDRLVAKERMVLGLINYERLVNEEWDSSSLLKKNNLLLLVFYMHRDGIPVIELEVKLVGLWEFPPEDLLIIKADWEKIREMVKAGKAHELSEGQTFYLRACTKDSKGLVHRSQPFSSEKAKQRAFSLKPSYVNTVIDRMRRPGPLEVMDSVIKDPNELRRESFEALVESRFEPYLGMTVTELTRALGIKASVKAKNFNDLVTKGILDVKGKIAEFEKAGVNVRSILLEASGALKESVSFPSFDYIQLANEPNWEESKTREMFERRFFFVVYQKRPDGVKELRKVMFWSMPYQDLMEVKRVWNKARGRVLEGRSDDMPRISESEVCHVRPHGRNAQDKILTPDGRMEVRKCFWLNAKYVAKQVGASKWSDCRQSKPSRTKRDSITTGEN